MISLKKPLKVVSWETSDYDPRFCRDGGSYPEVSVLLRAGNSVSISIEDTSCGDFGTRLDAYLDVAGMKYQAHWGSMEPDMSNSDIPVWLSWLLEEVVVITGYRIPDCETVALFWVD